MPSEEKTKQTAINVSEKAALIWDIATHLYGEYKPHEYGKVILPMTVIKRFDDCLKATKKDVLEKFKSVKGMAVGTKDAVLRNASKFSFYNTSKFDFEKLLADPTNITDNFNDYLAGFSDNVKDVIKYFEFDKEIVKMSQNDLLYTIIQEFNSKKADMSPDKVTSQDMGYIFEELVRKFSESYDEQAGAHFTARDIIYLMTELLVAPKKSELKSKGGSITAYDMTMGTSQMLACLDERLKLINPKINLVCYGQEFNPETFAIAKADMLIKGEDADNMKFGDTLSNDQFTDYKFDYIISNPPFGIDWKKEKAAVEAEAKLGYEGRFGPGLPSISDGQQLFLLNGVKKLKENGRMAIIQNGSSLFVGDAGSGPSEIRRYLLENDRVEAIVQLPTDLFYNTGISTYIWIISNLKEKRRTGKVQLINAINCFKKRRKNIGDKKVDLDSQCIDLVLKAYNDFLDNKKYFAENSDSQQIEAESKIYDNTHFAYIKITIETAKTDSSGEIVLRKGKPIAEKGKTDHEIVPFGEDVHKYFVNNVLPFNKNAFMYTDDNGHLILDMKKNKIGYEIPFVKLFYKFVEPKSSKEIFSQFKELTKNEQKLINEILEDN